MSASSGYRLYSAFPPSIRGRCIELENAGAQRRVLEIFDLINPAYALAREVRPEVREETEKEIKSIESVSGLVLPSEAPWIYQLETCDIDLSSFVEGDANWVPSDHISNYAHVYYVTLETLEADMSKMHSVSLTDLVQQDCLKYLW